MSLSDSERHILDELELAFAADQPQLAEIERSVRRRRMLVRGTAPLALLGAVLLVIVGVRLGGGVGTALGVCCYLAAVAAAYLATKAWGPTVRGLHWK